MSIENLILDGHLDVQFIMAMVLGLSHTEGRGKSLVEHCSATRDSVAVTPPCSAILVTGMRWTGLSNKRSDQIGRKCPKFVVAGDSGHLFDIWSWFSFSGLSNNLPVTARSVFAWKWIRDTTGSGRKIGATGSFFGGWGGGGV